METLGQEIGVGERQAQKYVAELERHELVRRVSRYIGRAQTSNGFEFLWHSLFEEGVNDRSPGRVNDQSGEGVIHRSPKESQSEESQIEENTTIKRIPGYASPKPRSAAIATLTYTQEPKSKHPKADAEFTDPDPPKVENPFEEWTPAELAEVRRRITAFWGREPEEGFEVSVMLRARGATATAVCNLLDQKFANKKFRIGGRYAPKSQNWFLTVIENEFTPGHLPEPPATVHKDQQQIESEILERGIAAIELPDAPRSIVESVTCDNCGRAALVRYTDGSIEGCGCRQKAPGGLERVPASNAPVCFISRGLTS